MTTKRTTRKISKVSRIVALLLLLCMMMTACGGPADSETPNDGTITGGADNNGTDSNTDNSDNSEFGGLNVEGMPEFDLKDKKVTVYCWSEYVAEKVHDWAGFRFIEYYGGEVETIVGTGGYYENLYKLISAGEIPDVVVAEATSFPNMIMRDLVQPWDDYLAYDDPIWDLTGAREEMEQMRWDGKIYNVTRRSHNLGVMFYNKRLVADTGLQDPAELQAEGKWTWDAFKEYLEATTVDNDGDGVTDVYGMVNTGDFPISFFASTGEFHIEFKDGKFINNIKSAKVQDAANFIYDLVNGNTRVMSLNDPVAEFLNGKAAFVYTNDYRGYVDYADLWETDGIGIVPMPAYKEGEPQYQASLVDYLYLMKGAKNPEGAALMALAQQYDTYLNVDPSCKDRREQTIKDFMSHGFTEEAATAVADINDMPHKIIWTRSIPMSEGNLEYRAMNTPWITLADSMYGAVDKAIKDACTPIE